MARPLVVEHCGLLGYGEALKLQEGLVSARRAGRGDDTLLLLQHPAVVTLGRSSHEENLRTSRAGLAAQGIDVFEVKRGGDVTYHAPGQLVGYAILDLAARDDRDLTGHLRRLEAVLCDVLRELGVAPRVVPGRTGVFVETPPGAPDRKIASIGVGARGWVTYHGFALNVDLDLSGFDVIVPCGLRDVEMTSIARERGAGSGPGLFEDVESRVRVAFERHFDAS